jgi:hypothetical protein
VLDAIRTRQQRKRRRLSQTFRAAASTLTARRNGGPPLPGLGEAIFERGFDIRTVADRVITVVDFSGCKIRGRTR